MTRPPITSTRPSGTTTDSPTFWLLLVDPNWPISSAGSRGVASTTTIYRQALGDLPGVDFMPEAEGCRSTFWLTCLTIDPSEAGTDREQIRVHLESLDIEARPVWKPMHLQPVFSECQAVGGAVSSRSLRAWPLPAQWIEPQRRGSGAGGRRSAGPVRAVKPILTAEEYRRVDQAYTGDLDAAMDHAGLAVALAAVRHGAGYGKRIVVLAGPGNNGGDGYVAARYLARRGADVVIQVLSEPKTPQAIRAAGLARSAGLKIVEMGHPMRADLVIDAVFGGGGRSDLSPVLEGWTETPAPVIAVDFPTGLDPDTGEAKGRVFSAVETVTFQYLKTGHVER